MKKFLTFISTGIGAFIVLLLFMDVKRAAMIGVMISLASLIPWDKIPKHGDPRGENEENS